MFDSNCVNEEYEINRRRGKRMSITTGLVTNVRIESIILMS